MRKRIVSVFFLLAFGISLLWFEIKDDPKTEDPAPEEINYQTRAGISLLTTDIGDMTAYADVISSKIISTCAAPTEDAIVITYNDYYIKDNCYVMTDRSVTSEPLYPVCMNDMIYASNPLFDDGEITWSYVTYRDETGDLKVGFIDSNNLLSEPISYTGYSIPNYSGFKSYMDYRAVTTKSSPAYRLTRESHISSEGICLYDDRYLIAIGLHFNAKVGDYVDLTLANGTVIKCVVGDRKSWRDTDSSMIFTKNDCMSEFIVNEDYLSTIVKHKGDISYAHDEWNSPVVTVRIYDKNVL